MWTTEKKPSWKYFRENNCGGCGYAGCSGLAAAIVKGEAEVGGCPVGGAPVAGKIGKIMGVDAAAKNE